MGRMRIVDAALATALVCWSCGGTTAPATPTPTGSTGSTGTAAVSGTVTATNGGQPLPRATITIGSASATSDAGGNYGLSVSTTAGAVPWSVSGPGAITHAGLLTAGAPRTLNLDAIAQGTAFDLGFYRELARNSLEAAVQPLRRLTVAPRVYLRTVDTNGRAIEPATLDLVASTITAVSSRWTGGRFSVTTVERGTDTHDGQPGWITVRFPAVQSSVRCGLTVASPDGATMDLEYDNPLCSCGGFKVAPRTVGHETGHAFGFFHTDGATDLMWGGAWPASLCSAGPTDREQYHAAIVYARPVGNTDPDTDPAGVVLLRPMQIP